MLILRDPLAFLESLTTRDGLVQVRIGPWRGYVACDPELVSQVLLDDRTFDKGGPLFERALLFLGEGVGTCPRRTHRRLRRLVQPAFHRDRLVGYAEVMSERIDAVTGSWSDGEDIIPWEQMSTITTEVLSACLLGARPGSEAVAQMRHVNAVLARAYWHMFVPTALRKLPTPGNHRYQRASAGLAAAVRQVISDYRGGIADQGGLLSTLLATRDDDGTGQLSDTELYDQVITFIVAGVDTVSVTLAWACHVLAHNPDLQDRVHTEARAVLGGRPARLVDLPRFELTDRVLHEVLRLYPPAWLVTRVVTRDADLAGHRLPAGSTIVYSPYLLHRRPDSFPDPDLFDPDRWLSAPPHRHPGYLPFAAGPRQCVGNDFTLMEAGLALATIADRWRLERPPSAPAVRPRPRMTLGLTPAPLRVHRRGHE